MDCEQAAARISALIDGELDEADRAALDAHLAECPACGALQKHLQSQDTALRELCHDAAAFAELAAAKVPATVKDRSKPPLLLVDDEPLVLECLALQLAGSFEVVTADSAEAARGWLGRRPIDLVLTDQKMPRCSGVQLLEWVYEHHPHTVRMLMTGQPEYEDMVSAINRGHIFSFIEKPWQIERVQQVLREAAATLEAERDRRRREEELDWLASERERELEEAHAQLLQRKRELERLALNDPLTGLLNRRSVEELARFELKRHARYPTSVALGAIDVDGLDRVNAAHDNPGGDAVLVGLARMLLHSVRETDSVGRVGGEEFLVVARETNEAGAVRLAERIRSTVAGTPVLYEGTPIVVTVSVGFSVAEPGVPADFARMSEVAWSAVWQAKAEGRNRFAVRRLEERRAV